MRTYKLNSNASWTLVKAIDRRKAARYGRQFFGRGVDFMVEPASESDIEYFEKTLGEIAEAD